MSTISLRLNNIADNPGENEEIRSTNDKRMTKSEVRMTIYGY